LRQAPAAPLPNPPVQTRDDTTVHVRARGFLTLSWLSVVHQAPRPSIPGKVVPPFPRASGQAIGCSEAVLVLLSFWCRRLSRSSSPALPRRVTEAGRPPSRASSLAW